MSFKKTLILTLVSTFLWSDTPSLDFGKLNGNWHLRVLDGKEVRKARAILDFDAKGMYIRGFDGCNRISGLLQGNEEQFSANLVATRMACREAIHSYVSTTLHKAVNEGFTIKEDKKHGIKGITLKSSNHELFFKRMGA